jgi:hypothetical protein
MQDIAQGGLHLGEKYITPSRILPDLPEIPVPQFQYHMEMEPYQVQDKKDFRRVLLPVL